MSGAKPATLSVTISVNEKDYALEVDVNYGVHVSGPDEGKPCGTRELCDLSICDVRFVGPGPPYEVSLALDVLARDWVEGVGFSRLADEVL